MTARTRTVRAAALRNGDAVLLRGAALEVRNVTRSARDRVNVHVVGTVRGLPVDVTLPMRPDDVLTVRDAPLPVLPPPPVREDPVGPWDDLPTAAPDREVAGVSPDGECMHGLPVQTCSPCMVAARRRTRMATREVRVRELGEAVPDLLATGRRPGPGSWRTSERMDVPALERSVARAEKPAYVATGRVPRPPR